MNHTPPKESRAYYLMTSGTMKNQNSKRLNASWRKGIPGSPEFIGESKIKYVLSFRKDLSGKYRVEFVPCRFR